MNFKYHIQPYAMQMHNVILSMPSDVKIDKEYLLNLDEDEFRFALSEIHEIFRSFYKGMADDPERFGMVAIEMPGERKAERDYQTGTMKNDNILEAGKKKTVSHFYKLQKALVYVFASVNNDMTGLAVDMGKLKNFKVRKLPEVLKRLEELGFEIVEDGGYLNITHENTDLFILLGICGFSCVTWTNFAADKKLKDSCVDFLIAQIFDDVDKEYFVKLHEFLLTKEFKYKLKRYSDHIIGTLTIRYKLKGKPESVAFGNMVTSVEIPNLNKHTDILDMVTETVRENVLESHDCIKCGPCQIKAYHFSYKGKEYIKCNDRGEWGCHFYNTTLEDFSSIKLLIESELSYVNK